jgi:hypothetical protein
MSNEIPVSFVQQYGDEVIHLIDQEGSQLKDKVRNKEVTGKNAYFDRLGRGVVYKKAGRHTKVTHNDVAHSRRRVTMDDYLWSDLIDEEDMARLLINFEPEYARAAAYDMGNKIDQIIIDAINGNAVSVDSDETGTNVALPTTQIVDEDFNTADSNLIVEKLIEAKRLLMKHSGNVSGEITMVINASASASLLNETEVQSADYNTIRALVNGQINSFMGFNFVTVKDGLLPGTADGTDSDPVRCLGFLKRSVGLAIGRQPQIRMDKLPEYGYATQILGNMTLGATRIEEEGVVAIECVQSA